MTAESQATAAEHPVVGRGLSYWQQLQGQHFHTHMHAHAHTYTYKRFHTRTQC